MNTGTNALQKPSFEGQLCVFNSPHCACVKLVDEAKRDRYGRLGWHAVQNGTQLYQEAIEWHRALVKLKASVRLKAKGFLQRYAGLIGSSLNSAEVDLDLIGFSRRLRTLAIHFINSAQSSDFWSLIDAMGCVEDAESSQWRFMTVNVRRNRIAHAHEHLSALSF